MKHGTSFALYHQNDDSNLTKLPDELLVYLFSFLETPDLFAISLVDKHFYVLANDDFLWRQRMPAHLGWINKDVRQTYFECKSFGCEYLAKEWDIHQAFIYASFKGDLSILAKVENINNKIQLLTLSTVNKPITNENFFNYITRISENDLNKEILLARKMILLTGAKMGNLLMIKRFLRTLNPNDSHYGTLSNENSFDNLASEETSYILAKAADLAARSGHVNILNHLFSQYGEDYQRQFTDLLCNEEINHTPQSISTVLKSLVAVGRTNPVKRILTHYHEALGTHVIKELLDIASERDSYPAMNNAVKDAIKKKSVHRCIIC